MITTQDLGSSKRAGVDSEVLIIRDGKEVGIVMIMDDCVEFEGVVHPSLEDFVVKMNEADLEHDAELSRMKVDEGINDY